MYHASSRDDDYIATFKHFTTTSARRKGLDLQSAVLNAVLFPTLALTCRMKAGASQCCQDVSFAYGCAILQESHDEIFLAVHMMTMRLAIPCSPIIPWWLLHC